MPKQDNTEKNGKLPANIESATRSHVAENLAAWQANIISARAARLGISVGEASQVEGKPLFVLEAEKRARIEGRDVNAILQEYSDQLQRSQYPTAQCLMPDEVAEYVEAVLPSQRHQHIQECNECAMLVAAAQPEPREAAAMEDDDFLREPERVPAYAAAAVAMPARRQSEGRFGTHARLFFLANLKKWGLVASPVLVIFLADYLYTKLRNAGTSWPIESSGEVWFLAACGLFLYLVSLVGFRTVPRYRGLANGFILAAIIFGYASIDARENRRIAESAFQWNGAASLGMTSIQQLQSTGTFLGPQHASIPGHSLTGNSGSVNIDVKTSADEATYVVTASELPGQITVDVHGESGSLKWEDGDKTIKKADLLTGWVEVAKSGDSAGAEPEKELVVGPQHYKCAACALLPASGTRIVATVNPATARVENYLVISQKSVVKIPERRTEKQ